MAWEAKPSDDIKQEGADAEQHYTSPEMRNNMLLLEESKYQANQNIFM